ncbi:MAG TPA: thioredoxin family protein [Acidimicrobiia bacterium]|nr:thioredoxin family protein [Acidimicrobiia bacterium]
MIRALIGAALLGVVLLATRLASRRRQPAPAPAARRSVPAQLYRADFPNPDAPWIAVLFSSSTCASCAPMADKVRALESDDVAVAVVEFTQHRDLHERYAIDAVPLVVIADRDGVTRASFAGAVSAADLWAAVAQLRDE